MLSKLSTMNDKSSFVKVPLVITNQLVIPAYSRLYVTNSSRIPTQASRVKIRTGDHIFIIHEGNIETTTIYKYAHLISGMLGGQNIYSILHLV
jgi:hypothetical protein